MDLRVAIRVAVKSALGAALEVLYAPYEVFTITYRPTRAPIVLPAVTFYDTGVKSDDVVPLYDRSLHVDVWTAGDLDHAEDVAHEVNRVLDHQPLDLPGGEGQVAFFALQADDDLPQADADLVRKHLRYRMLVYSFTDPPPFGEA